MTDHLLEQLRSLCGFGAPSGWEKPLAQALLNEQPRGCAEQYTDAMGNLIRTFPCNDPEAPWVLLDAHLDEIGFVVTQIDGSFLRFFTVGGVDPRMLPTREVRLLTEPPLVGVITGGLNSDEDTPFDKGDLCIDTGLAEEELKRRVPVGTVGVYAESTYALGGSRYCGKAMDDRACYLMLLRAMELCPAEERQVNVVVLGSVKEETGGEGAVTAAFALNPACCIAVDVTHGSTTDGPKSGAFPLGGGPAIGVGPNMTRWLTERMEACAENSGIPCGFEVMSGNTGTNGWELQISREGIPTGILSLPLRYMHTPVEVFDRDDFEHGARLLAEVLKSLRKEELR